MRFLPALERLRAEAQTALEQEPVSFTQKNQVSPPAAIEGLHESGTLLVAKSGYTGRSTLCAAGW